jgi:hypothetical protein
MASITGKKALFFVTSPRTPFKMIPEIRLLVDQFHGKKWNTKTQQAFATALSKSEFFEGTLSVNDDFGARDRINRAPKALGFVDLTPKIELTAVGKNFLTSNQPHEIFTRQLLKFQLPSPYHIDKGEKYFVKPYLELLRLIYDLGYLSKDEIAIFAMQLMHIKMYPKIKAKILAFREKKKNLSRNITSYKRFAADIFKEELLNQFKQEIKANKIKTRQSSQTSLKKFTKTKRNNHKDYADAAIRYLRATSLVSVQSKTYNLFIPAETKRDVEYILENTPRNPIRFVDQTEFKAYLFDARYPLLLTDNREELIQTISKYLSRAEIIKLQALPIESLKNERDRLFASRIEEKVSEQTQALQTYDEYDDIKTTYADILGHDVVDPSLIMEWNTWRAFVMIDDGNITGNFRFDINGMPLTTAPPNMPDIVCEYNDFNIVVEVTLSTGYKQYDMEGEPVTRHLALHKQKTKKLTYCIFVATKINSATLAHFFALHKIHAKFYGGTSQIIPMDLETFIAMLKHAYEQQKKPSAQSIKEFAEYICKQALTCVDEDDWYHKIMRTSKTWTIPQNFT